MTAAAPPIAIRHTLGADVRRAAARLAVCERAVALAASRRGGVVIEVNPSETELSPLANLSLRGPAGAVLECLLDRTIAARPPESPS